MTKLYEEGKVKIYINEDTRPRTTPWAADAKELSVKVGSVKIRVVLNEENETIEITSLNLISPTTISGVKGVIISKKGIS
jgi:hypothetical protein